APPPSPCPTAPSALSKDSSAALSAPPPQGPTVSATTRSSSRTAPPVPAPNSPRQRRTRSATAARPSAPWFRRSASWWPEGVHPRTTHDLGRRTIWYGLRTTCYVQRTAWESSREFPGRPGAVEGIRTLKPDQGLQILSLLRQPVAPPPPTAARRRRSAD